MRKTLLWVLALGLVLGTTARLPGVVISVDNFDHKDPALPGWTKVDLSDGQPWGPGEYDPTSGALRIYHSGNDSVGPGEPFTKTAMFALWNNSVDPLYSNGYLRAKVRTNEEMNSTSVIMRANLATATGYLLLGVTKSPSERPEFGGSLGVSKFVNGVETHIWSGWEDGIDYRTGTDWNVELGAMGARITAKVWKVGDPEPSVPQFDWVDPDPIPSGMIALSSDKFLGNEMDARGDATFDDIVFCIPEPATWALLLIGLLPVCPVRRLK